MLAGVFAAGGCGHSDSYTGPNGEKVTVSKDGKSIDVKTEKGSSKINVSAGDKGLALPDDFPKDAPVYPGAIVLSSINSNDGMMITLQTVDSADKVAEYYEKELKGQAWTTESNVKLPQARPTSTKRKTL